MVGHRLHSLLPCFSQSRHHLLGSQYSQVDWRISFTEMGNRWSSLKWDETANEKYIVRLRQLRHLADRDLDPDEVHDQIIRLCEGWAFDRDGLPKSAEEIHWTRQEHFGLSSTEHYRAHRPSPNAYIYPYLLSFVDEADRTNWGRGGWNLYRKGLVSFFGHAPAAKTAWYGIIYARPPYVGEEVEKVDYKRWEYFAFALIKRKKCKDKFRASRTLVIFDPIPCEVTRGIRPKDLVPMQYSLWHLARNSGRKNGKSHRKVDFYYSQDTRFSHPDDDLTACLHWVDYHASRDRQHIATECDEILNNCYQIKRS